LNKKSIILSLLLVFLYTGLSLGQTDNNTSTTEAISANDTALPAGINETAVPAETAPDLNYIWSFSGIEDGAISMVINQEGSDIFGQAKYEPEGGKAWNADVVGSVTGNDVELTMTVQKEEETITTKMTGVYSADTINGNFTQISGGKKVGTGTFSAMWINPDTSKYTPAVIEKPKAETSTNDTAVSETPATQTTQTQTKSRFTDVHEYADKIGPGGDLSGVPPGMGGSGL
jgi:hypothetical protein